MTTHNLHIPDHVIHIEQLIELEKDKYRVVQTNPLEKLIPSIINSIFVFGLMTPVLMYFGSGLVWKWSVVVAFAFYEGVMFIFFKDRCLGMKIMDTYHRFPFKASNHVLYNFLYTASFATLLLYVWYPFDLLLINIFCIQLPCVLLTGTTLHGYVSNIETVKIVAK